MRLANSLRRTVVSAETWWFDFRRGVKTAGDVPLARLTLTGSPEGSLDYIAGRIANARSALRALPIRDHSQFTFLDLGSGKGPVLFLAAEYPYRKIRGVEFAKELHLQAVENIAKYRSRKQRCGDIQSIHIDARSFQFPEENLVIYLFNPFGPAILDRVLDNLGASLARKPREVFLVSLYPEPLAPVFQSQPWLERRQTTRRYHVYRAV